MIFFKCTGSRLRSVCAAQRRLCGRRAWSLPLSLTQTWLTSRTPSRLRRIGIGRKLRARRRGLSPQSLAEPCSCLRGSLVGGLPARVKVQEVASTWCGSQPQHAAPPAMAIRAPPSSAVYDRGPIIWLHLWRKAQQVARTARPPRVPSEAVLTWQTRRLRSLKQMASRGFNSAPGYATVSLLHQMRAKMSLRCPHAWSRRYPHRAQWT